MKYFLCLAICSNSANRLQIVGIFIVAAKRTPFGTYGGKFVQKSAAELQQASTQAALAAGGIKPELVDSVVFGNVLAVS